MKILLINENPVITKLVTLSSQKTSDELDIVDNIENINQDNYGLVVIDDTLCTEDIISELKSKIRFKKSLIITSDSNYDNKDFTKVLKKPFLPTDLVELFSEFGKDNLVEDDIDDIESFEDTMEDNLEIDGLEDSVENIDSLIEDNLDDELSLEEEFNLDDMDDFGDLNEPEESSESVLDEDDVQEVQELLNDEFNLEDAENETIEDLSSDTNLEDELEFDDELEDEDELGLDDELESEVEDELELGDELESEVEEELPLEKQIENAVGELTEEDLETEVDEETLIDMVTKDINSLDSLTSRDLKLAIGEDVEPEEKIEQETVEEESIDDIENSEDDEKHQEIEKDEIVKSNSGVEALKTLLKALTNEDVVASLDGMKININITLGDN